MTNNTLPIEGSFRDPNGEIYLFNGDVIRRIDIAAKDDFNFFMESGLYHKLSQEDKVVSHEEIENWPEIFNRENTFKVIRPTQIELITWPFEWSFGQLRNAALLTLDICIESLSCGLILKDASAYNVQFIKNKAIFIDTLSFTRYKNGEPWVAYRQFCQHFLIPLLLMSKVDQVFGRYMAIHLDGIPLEIGSQLLPRSSWLNFPILTHVHLHSVFQSKFSTERKTTQEQRQVSKTGLLGILVSLQSLIKKLELKNQKSEWANYYSNTNYEETSFEQKRQILRKIILEVGIDKPRILDLGANTGYFSRSIADLAKSVVSADFDINAININYQLCIKENATAVYPILLDLMNPSADLGWYNSERSSFHKRVKPDITIALALIHHLVLSNHVPLFKVAQLFATLSEWVILEFPEPEDSQVQILLSQRRQGFHQYSVGVFESQFARLFEIKKRIQIPDSKRIFYLLRRLK